MISLLINLDTRLVDEYHLFVTQLTLGLLPSVS